MSRRLINLRRSARSRPVVNSSSSLGSSSSSGPGRWRSRGGEGASECSGRQEADIKVKWDLQSQHILKELGRIFHCQDDENEEEEGLLEVTDVTLFSSEGDCVQAHKIVLILCSPFFRKLFIQVNKTQKKERDNAIVVLGNVKSDHLKNLVRFMYTGEVTVSSVQELNDFKEVAYQFGIETVSWTSPSQPNPSKPILKKPTGFSSFGKKYKARSQRQKVFKRVQVLVEEEPPTSDEDSSTNKFDQKTANQTEKRTGAGASVDNENAESVSFKIEPSDEIHFDDDLDDIHHHEMPVDDDGGSNFSDELLDHQQGSEGDDGLEDDKKKDPDIAFKKIPKKKRSFKKISGADDSSDGGGAKLDWRTGKWQGWKRIEPLAEEDLKRDWRKKTTTQAVSNVTTLFYCPYAARKCPALLKIKTLLDGTDLYFRNNYEHANHRGPNDNFGLTPPQKEFVLECIKNGVTQPSCILLKFDLSDIPKPQRTKLLNLLGRLKKKPEMTKYWTKREPKWPRRIRKKPERVGPPKKIGRPTKAELEVKKSGNDDNPRVGSSSHPSSFVAAHQNSSIASGSRQQTSNTSTSSVNDSASSSPVPLPPSAIGLLSHPNHYPGQGFVVNPSLAHPHTSSHIPFNSHNSFC